MKFLKEIGSIVSLRYRLYGRYDIKAYTSDIHTRLLELMEAEKLYLDANIDEEKIMARLGTNRFYLSRCIKIYEKCSFREFLNRMRVGYAQRLFMSNISIKLLQMCYASGFNSLSTFYRAFINEVGVSPARWCIEYKIKLLRSLKRR